MKDGKARLVHNQVCVQAFERRLRASGLRAIARDA